MLNEKRVKLMTQMAMYEAREGEKDFKISGYYQKDYISLHTWITVIWTTIGYAFITGALFLVFLDEIFTNPSLFQFLILGSVAFAGYIAIVVISIIVARNFYRKKHVDARKRVKKFNRELLQLSKMYEKEIR
ncbi:hypothetical protein [Faecalimonas sp.]